MRKIGWAFSALLLFAPFSDAFAQTGQVETQVVVPYKQKYKQKYRGYWRGAETSSEKSIAVDAKVNVSLCVREGNLKVNGWERDEIRVFVVDGNEIGFSVREKNRQDKAIWLKISGFNKAKDAPPNSRDCLSGRDIELDVPRGAVVNVVSSASEASVNAVRKAVVKNLGGDIYLNDIEQGIQAATYEGDVMVENSGGAISLETTNGNIVALDVAPGEIGDAFKAKTTSGAITLQKIGHRQTEINTNSGAIRFNGEFHNGGQYVFGTTNGTISLAVPEKSSFRVNATYGSGAFNSELKLNIITVNNTARTQSISASCGDGDANVNLTTYSGAIRIKKQ